MKLARRMLILWVVVYSLVLLTGCTSSWVQSASTIITILGPMIAGALAILSAFGTGISPTVLASIQKWSADAQSALSQVKTLIDGYNAAPDSAKAGILNQIETILGEIVADLNALLPLIHITDPATEAKVSAIVTLIQSELTALVALIPVITSATAQSADAHAQLKAITTHPAFAQLKSAKDLKNEYNHLAGEFSDDYKIK